MIATPSNPASWRQGLEPQRHLNVLLKVKYFR